MSRDTFYCIGTAAGPHPYPMMVRDFQCVIGNETRAQIMEQEGRLPDSLVAAIGGGSNAIGLFHPFLDDESVEMFGVEAAGHGLDRPQRPRRLDHRRPPRRLHGNRTYLLQDRRRPDPRRPLDLGRPRLPGRRAGARLAARRRPGDLPVGHRQGGAGRLPALLKLEGIIPALEPAHALAKVIELAPKRPKDHLMVMNMCGRGDKDIFAVAEHLGGM